MKILVAVAAYPVPDGSRPLYYVHSRNIFYKEAGLNVTVLNFAAKNNYVYDGFSVITESDYAANNEQYDLLVCHASNLRNHYRFLMKYGKRFSKIVFFFHGHEMLHINRYYPVPYSYMGGRKNGFLQNRYDDLKLFLWSHYFRKHINDIRLIFVSEWIFEHFLKETGISEEELKGHWRIISNGVGKFFEEHSYAPGEIFTDFITIRNNFDGSTYCLDIITELAHKYPNYRFLVIGKGMFFDHVQAPNNMVVLKTELTHDEMEQHLNSARFALMPVRQDTQGLMSCEMATYGIPLITSDIQVCRQVFKDCPNVAFISNDSPQLEDAVARYSADRRYEKWERYFAKNTILKEIDYLIQYGREG